MLLTNVRKSTQVPLRPTGDWFRDAIFTEDRCLESSRNEFRVTVANLPRSVGRRSSHACLSDLAQRRAWALRPERIGLGAKYVAPQT